MNTFDIYKDRAKPHNQWLKGGSRTDCYKARALGLYPDPHSYQQHVRSGLLPYPPCFIICEMGILSILHRVLGRISIVIKVLRVPGMVNIKYRLLLLITIISIIAEI